MTSDVNIKYLHGYNYPTQRGAKMSDIITVATDKRTVELLPMYVFTIGKNHDQEYRDRTSDSPYHHFLYVQEGAGIFEFPDGKHVVQKGNIVFFRKEYPVIYRCKKDRFVTAWVSFEGSCVDKMLEYLHVGNYAIFKSENIWYLMENMYKTASEGATPEVLSNKLYKLIVAYFSEMNKEAGPSMLGKVKEYVESNYAKDISVSDMAKVAGVSESLVYRTFRQKENMTPIDYLQSVRVENAKRIMLEDAELKISDVAEKCGFSNTAYFCKVFKKLTKMTPMAYKKLHFY